MGVFGVQDLEAVVIPFFEDAGANGEYVEQVTAQGKHFFYADVVGQLVGDVFTRQRVVPEAQAVQARIGKVFIVHQIQVDGQQQGVAGPQGQAKGKAVRNADFLVAGDYAAAVQAVDHFRDQCKYGVAEIGQFAGADALQDFLLVDHAGNAVATAFLVHQSQGPGAVRVDQDSGIEYDIRVVAVQRTVANQPVIDDRGKLSRGAQGRAQFGIGEDKLDVQHVLDEDGLRGLYLHVDVFDGEPQADHVIHPKGSGNAVAVDLGRQGIGVQVVVQEDVTGDVVSGCRGVDGKLVLVESRKGPAVKWFDPAGEGHLAAAVFEGLDQSCRSVATE